MTQTLFGLVVTFMYLLRQPSVAALVVTIGVFLNLPYILPAYHDLDLVLAALLSLSAGILLGASYLGRLSIVPPRDYTAAVCVWLASALVSVVFSDRPGISYEAFLTVLPYVVLSIMLLALIADRRAMMLVFTGLILASAGLSLLALVQWTLGLGHLAFGGLAIGELMHISGDINEIRPGGPVADANFFAAYLLPGAMLAAARFFRAEGFWLRTLYAILAILTVCGILLTASRGALGALGLGVMLLFVLERKVWPWIASGVLVIILMSVFPPAYVERITQTFSLASVAQQQSAAGAEIEDEALAGRLGSMQVAVEMFTRHPVTGVGYGQYETNFQAYVAQYDLRMRNQARGAHTLYLEIAAETGIVGLVAFALLLALGARNITRLGSALRAEGDRAAFLEIRGYGVAIVTLLAAHTFLHDAKAHYIWLFICLLFIPPEAVCGPGRQQR